MPENNENTGRVEIPSRWWSAGEVADALNVSQQTISRWLRDGLLGGHRFGGVWRIADADLQEFLARARHAADGVRAGGESEFGERLAASQADVEPNRVEPAEVEP